MQLRVLSAADVRQAISMRAAIKGMKVAFAQCSGGRARVPLRNRIDVPAASGTALFMPAFLPAEKGSSAGTLAVKTVSIYGDNPRRGLPTIHAVVQLLDADSGIPTALIEGGTLTAIRTGAASGAATDLLARADAKTAAIFGSGVQARTQLEAVCTVRGIQQVWVYSPSDEHAQTFAAEMAGRGPIPKNVDVAKSPQNAVAQADVICAATTSKTPVFDGRDLKDGAHVNGIGSYLPDVQELDAVTIRRALVVVDSREAVLAEAGDLIIPIGQGLISEEHIHAELGEIVAGRRPGRTSSDQITCFKSCGIAVQDAAAAQIAFAEAQRLNLGTTIAL